MKTITTIALSLGLLISLSLNAQNKTTSKKQTVKVENSQNQTTKIKLLEEIPATQNRPVVINGATKTARIPIRSNARVSDYLSLEKEIMKRTISGKIPKDLPKHIEGQTEEVYLQILKSWGKKNLHLIKKEYHSEL